MNKTSDRLNQMLDLSPELARLCKPLFRQTPVAHYSFAEVDPKGFCLVSSNKKALEANFSASLFLKETALYRKYLQHEGFFLSALRPDFLEEARQFQNLEFQAPRGQECIYIEKTESLSMRLHFFYGTPGDESLNPFFLNNTSILRYFSRYTQNELAPLLGKIIPHPFPMAKRTRVQSHLRFMTPLKISTSRFFRSFPFWKSISHRQWEVIYWYVMGKTSDETAAILGVKPGTIETHFLRIRKKLGCKSKQQIFTEIFSHSDFWNDFGVVATEREI